MSTVMTEQADNWSLARPSARRSLIMCALGAIAGLIIAGFGLFTAKGTRTSSVPPEDVALINQVPILMSDYLSQLRALYDVSLSQATPQQKKQVLDDMVREELYVQRGIELGMQADTTEVRQALVGSVEAQAQADATIAQPDESQLRHWYSTHVQTYSTAGEMAVDDYLLPTVDQRRGDMIASELRQDSGTPAAAARLGLRRTARMSDGTEFYFAARIHLGDVLFGKVRALAPGAVSDVVRQPDGLHVVVMRNNDAPVPLAYDQVRDRVMLDYVGAQAKLLNRANERFLRKRADILIQSG